MAQSLSTPIYFTNRGKLGGVAPAPALCRSRLPRGTHARCLKNLNHPQHEACGIPEYHRLARWIVMFGGYINRRKIEPHLADHAF